MVAVPKNERKLNHISKPLRYQMMNLIDRTRWPVLVTYSDESQGHTGHVYKCSGWEKTFRKQVSSYVNNEGARKSKFSVDGRLNQLISNGKIWIQRWEHWVCTRGSADEWLKLFGWGRIATTKIWRSGNPGFKIVKIPSPGIN